MKAIADWDAEVAGADARGPGAFGN